MTLARWLDTRQEMGFESTMAIVLQAISLACPDALPHQHVDAVAAAWRLSGEEKRKIRFAVESWRSIANAADSTWSSIQPLLIDRDIETAISVATAITRAENLDPGGVEFCRQRLSLSPEILDPAPLLTGDQLRESGYQPGPQFRVWLKRVRDAQLDGEIATTEQAFRLIEQDHDPPR